MQPGNADVVHHVILFTVPPDQVADAEALDAAAPGEGWTCFGGSGLRDNDGLNSAPWLGAWAPGGKESISAPGFGKPLAAGQPDHHAGPLQPAGRTRPGRVRDPAARTRRARPT